MLGLCLTFCSLSWWKWAWYRQRLSATTGEPWWSFPMCLASAWPSSPTSKRIIFRVIRKIGVSVDRVSTTSLWVSSTTPGLVLLISSCFSTEGLELWPGHWSTCHSLPSSTRTLVTLVTQWFSSTYCTLLMLLTSSSTNPGICALSTSPTTTLASTWPGETQSGFPSCILYKVFTWPEIQWTCPGGDVQPPS